MGGGYNEASVVPNTEGLQEVRVIQNNFSAEYGRGQAIIAMSTKSGTNAFHGNGVYMMRNEHLDANTFATTRRTSPSVRSASTTPAGRLAARFSGTRCSSSAATTACATTRRIRS